MWTVKQSFGVALQYCYTVYTVCICLPICLCLCVCVNEMFFLAAAAATTPTTSNDGPAHWSSCSPTTNTPAASNHPTLSSSTHPATCSHPATATHRHSTAATTYHPSTSSCHHTGSASCYYTAAIVPAITTGTAAASSHHHASDPSEYMLHVCGGGAILGEISLKNSGASLAIVLCYMFVAEPGGGAPWVRSFWKFWS